MSEWHAIAPPTRDCRGVGAAVSGQNHQHTPPKLLMKRRSARTFVLLALVAASARTFQPAPRALASFRAARAARARARPRRARARRARARARSLSSAAARAAAAASAAASSRSARARGPARDGDHARGGARAARARARDAAAGAVGDEELRPARARSLVSPARCPRSPRAQVCASLCMKLAADQFLRAPGRRFSPWHVGTVIGYVSLPPRGPSESRRPVRRG